MVAPCIHVVKQVDSSASTGPRFFLLEPHAMLDTSNGNKQTSMCGAETVGFKTTGFEP
jgi:hypothetical protein